EPARARPVPFWRQGLAPPPETIARVLVAAVPRRRAGCSARTLWWTSVPTKRAPKAVSSSLTFLAAAAAPGDSSGASGIGSHLDDAAARSWDRPAHQEQVLLAVHGDDLEALLSDSPVAHLARSANPREHARRGRRRADRARGAHVVRPVRLGSADEVVTLDRPLEALALRRPRDLHARPDLEGLHRHGPAELQLGGLVAKLRQMAQRGRVGLLEVAELGLGQMLLLGRAESQLHRVVA